MRIVNIIMCVLFLTGSLEVSGAEGVEGSVPRSIKQIATLNSSSYISAIALSPDGKYVASLSDHDSNVDLWDVERARLVSTIDIGGNGFPGGHNIAWTTDGKYVATCGGRPVAFRIWNVSTGEVRDVLMGPGSGCKSMSASPDGQQFAISSRKSTLIFDVKTWTVEKSYAFQLSFPVSNTQVKFSPDSHMVAISQVGFWPRDLQSGVVLWNMNEDKPGEPFHPFGNQQADIQDIDFSSDGKELVMAIGQTSKDAITDPVMIWDIKRVSPSPRFTPLKRRVSRIQFSLNGKSLVVAGRDRNGVIDIVNISDSKVIAELTVGNYISSMAIGPGENKFCVASGNKILILEY